MTQKEAIVEALRRLGGKARMGEICKFARMIGDFSGSQNQNATIRNCIYTHPLDFIKSEEKDYWQLTSYQEEISSRDQRIKELVEENTKLKAVKTEDDFVEKVVAETKKRFKYKSERNKAVAISQILSWAGREDASENLDAWIEGKETKSLMNVAGDYVVSKHVENEIDYIEAGGTGVNINRKAD